MPGTVLAIEAEPLQIDADGGIERAATLLRQCNAKLHRLVKKLTHLDRLTNPPRKPRQLAGWIKARTGLLDVLEPPKRTIDRRSDGVRPIGRRGGYLDGDGGAHYADGPGAAGGGHLAFERASTTAWEKASLLSVAPDT